MKLTPDELFLGRWEFIVINATLVYTWLIMGLLVAVSWLVTRKLSTGAPMSRLQNMSEVVVVFMQRQISAVGHQESEPCLPFIGTLFLFIAASNLLSVVPGFLPPTGSLSTTTALAFCVFAAVPLFGIRSQGWRYFKNYAQPSIFMLPLNIMGEFSRTVALAVRLFGNVMSGSLIGGILLSVTPLFFPVVMQAFGLLTGLIQAYIFTVLATVFIAAAAGTHAKNLGPDGLPEKGEGPHG